MTETTRTCAHCTKRAHSRGFCVTHYRRWRLYGDALGGPGRWPTFDSPEERFWSHVDKSAAGGCWVWTAAVNDRGYGLCDRKLSGSGLAHRTAWIITHGAIPDGLLLCHRCDNPPCCNPAHLFVGTQADNIADCIAKGRKTNPPSGQGKRNPHRKLTYEQAQAIRARHGTIPQPALAEEYGVSRGTISSLLRGRTYQF